MIFQLRWVRFVIALLYLTIISILFFLPGAAFPHENWMSRIYFDKWVHIGFFILLIILWCWALKSTNKTQIVAMLLVAALYGISVEIVQDQFVVNRSFDMTDWVADMTGAVIGGLLWVRYIKNRPL